jgi:hypothetical protein
LVDDLFAELGWGVLVQELDQVAARSLDRDLLIEGDHAFDLLVLFVHLDSAFSDDRFGAHRNHHALVENAVLRR